MHFFKLLSRIITIELKVFLAKKGASNTLKSFDITFSTAGVPKSLREDTPISSFMLCYNYMHCSSLHVHLDLNLLFCAFSPPIVIYHMATVRMGENGRSF